MKNTEVVAIGIMSEEDLKVIQKHEDNMTLIGDFPSPTTLEDFDAMIESHDSPSD